MNKALIKASAIVVLMAVTTLISGCAGVSKELQALQDIFNKTKDKPKVTGVRMRSGETSSNVEVKASKAFKFVSYRMHNPRRLAVEMRGIDSNIAGDILAGNDKLIEKIVLVNFRRAGSVRAEIYMKEPYEYDMQLDGSTLKVAVWPDESEEIVNFKKKLKAANDKIKWLEMQLSKKKDASGPAYEVSKVTVSNPSLKRKQVQTTKPSTQAPGGPDDEAAGQEAAAALKALRNQDKKEKPKTSSATKAPEKKKSPNVEVRDTFAAWLAAWRGRDLKAYETFYDKKFTFKEKSRKAWRKKRAGLFKKTKKLTIDVSNVKADISKDTAILTFTQRYTSDIFSDVGTKTLKMKQRKEGWKIVSETWVKIK